MSGTSADGVDAALVHLDGRPPDLSIQVLSFCKTSFPEDVRARIFQLFGPSPVAVDRLGTANMVLGEVFAQAATAVVQKAGLEMDQVDLIASHGQTVYHAVGRGQEVPATLQIGEPSVIAERTGVTTVADFRPRDVAAGGQGAPLVSFVDYLLFRHQHRGRAIQNIGGIANVTALPPNAKEEDVLAFDTGPGNMLLDFAVETLTDGRQLYDRDGRMARRGTVHPGLLGHLMAHPYLRQPPPKTTGREQFGRQFGQEVLGIARDMGLSAEDVVATLTAFTAESIAQSYADFLPFRVEEVVMGGGGAYNTALVDMLAQRLAPARVLRHEDFGLSSDAKEAVAFAVLGYEAVHGRPNTLPGCTGARRPVVMGKVVPGANYRVLMRRVGRQWDAAAVEAS